jgi:hypothetical protein
MHTSEKTASSVVIHFPYLTFVLKTDLYFPELCCMHEQIIGVFAYVRVSKPNPYLLIHGANSKR